jgi:hypothetical protein
MKTNNENRDISTVLEENPRMRSLYEAVFSYLKSLGPVEAVPHKTQISFGGKGFKTNFAFVWAPGVVNRSVPKGSIMLTIDLPREETSPRIHESVNLRPGRWAHHVLIAKDQDFDDDVKGWLRESFAFGKVGLREWRKRASSNES